MPMVFTVRFSSVRTQQASGLQCESVTHWTMIECIGSLESSFVHGTPGMPGLRYIANCYKWYCLSSEYCLSNSDTVLMLLLFFFIYKVYLSIKHIVFPESESERMAHNCLFYLIIMNLVELTLERFRRVTDTLTWTDTS